LQLGMINKKLGNRNIYIYMCVCVCVCVMPQDYEDDSSSV